MRILAVALEVLHYLVVQHHWHAGALRKFVQRVDLLIQYLLSYVYASNDLGEVSNGEGVEANSRDHPTDGDDLLVNSARIDFTKAHSREGLEGPVDRRQVLYSRLLVDVALANDPSFRVKVVKPRDEEPEATHEMD